MSQNHWRRADDRSDEKIVIVRGALEKAGVSGDRSPRFRPDDSVLQLLASI
jgi:hypothetical protein